MNQTFALFVLLVAGLFLLLILIDAAQAQVCTSYILPNGKLVICCGDATLMTCM